MSRDYPHMNGLLLAVPWSGRPLPPEIVTVYAALQPPMNFNFRYLQVKGWPIDAARNFFCDKALELKCKYLFMMDEDVAVPSFAIRQLIHRLEHDEGAAVAAGIYCQKAVPPEPMVFRENGNGPFWKWKAGELFECESIGMGCALVRVAALADVEKPWFKTVDDNSPMLDNINRLVGWTEDIWFCTRVRKAGWKILADGGILPDHLDLVTGAATRLPPDSYPVQHLQANGKKKIIDLGCGETPYRTDEGRVITCDIRESVNPDYRVDLRVLPFATGEFDIVHSSHALEHFSRDETDKVLDEWVRILKPDGEMRLVLPSVEWAADQIKRGIVDNDVLNVLYGSQEYKENFHKMGFTPASLRKMLEDRGFKAIDISTQGYNIVAIARRKPPPKRIKGVKNGSLQRDKPSRKHARLAAR